MAHETEKAIYLCEQKDIRKWAMLLKRNAVLRIKIKKEKLSEPAQCILSEYKSFKNIPAKACEIYNFDLSKNQEQDRKELLDSYLHAFSRWLIRDLNNMTSQNDFDNTAKTITALCNRMELYKLPEEYMIKIMTEYGESGEYAMSDKYNGTNNRIWNEFATHLSSKIASKFTKTMTESFRSALLCDTGGFYTDNYYDNMHRKDESTND